MDEGTPQENPDRDKAGSGVAPRNSTTDPSKLDTSSSFSTKIPSLAETDTESEAGRCCHHTTLVQWLIFAAIVAVGAFIRFVMLDRIPPGLWYDEALYSLDGYKVSQGQLAMFFAEHGHPREPLFPWMLGAAFALFEPTVLVARCVSALCGSLAVAIFFPVARRFMPANWALAATAAFAAFRWHIHFSRTIFRAGLASLMALLAVWMFLRWRERRRPVDAILCGLAVAAGLYTYISLRVMPVLLVMWIGWMLWRKTISLRRDWKNIALIFVTLAIAFLPLGIDYLRHPDHLFGRTGEITMFEKDVEVTRPDGTKETIRVPKSTGEAIRGILQNAWGVARVWFIHGDYVARHGVPYRPIFDPVTGLLFLLGIVLCTARLVRGGVELISIPSSRSAQSIPNTLPTGLASLVLLTWFAAFAMASVLSFGAPNILRMQGASPVVILLMILGLRELTMQLPSAISRSLRYALPTVILIFFAALQLNDYFRTFPGDLRVRSAFGADFFYAPAKAVDNLARSVDTVYIPEEFLESLQVKFITIRHENIAGYSPDEPLPIGAANQSAAWLITARSISLAQKAGEPQDAQLQSIPGAHRIEAFTLPLSDEDGRLRQREPWAELWLRR